MMKMKMKNRAIAFSALAVTGALTLAGTSSLAGFEWKAPTQTPVITTESVMQEAAKPSATPAAAAPVVTPAAPVAAPVAQTAPTAPAPASTTAADSALTGFGSDLPMVIALQQVVPAGYQFSFAEGVNPGASVSWEGGKPWGEVLAAMLAPQKLGYTLNNNVITIMPASAIVPPAPVAAPQAVVAVAPVAAAPVAAAPVPVATPAPVPAKVDTFADDSVIDEDEPVIMRRTGRRGAVATRRDVAGPGHRDWFDRFKDTFQKKPAEQKPAVAAAAPVTTPAAAAPATIPSSDVQWNKEEAKAPAPAVAAAPEAPTVPVVEKAAAVEAAPLPVAPVTEKPSAPVEDIKWSQEEIKKEAEAKEATAPIALTAAPTAKPAAAPAPVEKPKSDIVSGFGTDLPLSVALMQVLPAGYAPSFGDGVDKNQFVSWQGGKPWADVLTEMLAPQKLTFAVSDKTVKISTVEPAPAPVVATAAPAKTETLPPAPEKTITSRRSTTAAPAQGTQLNWFQRMKNKLAKKEQPTATGPAVTAAPVTDVAQEVAPAPVAVPLTAAPKTQVIAPVVKPVWFAAKDMTLKEALTKWADIAHVDIYWPIDYDYHLSGDIAYGGTFEEAVGKLLGTMSKTRPQPYGELHHVAGGRDVLIVNIYALHN